MDSRRSLAALIGRVLALLLFLNLFLISPSAGSGAVTYFVAIIITACYVPATLNPRNVAAWRAFFVLAVPVATLWGLGLSGQAYALGLDIERLPIPLVAWFLLPVVVLVAVTLLSRLASGSSDSDG